MKKVLVFGGKGMAGHMIVMYLEELGKYEVYNTVSIEKLNENSIICNILEKEMVQEIIDEVSPDVIINCIGILNDKSDRDKSMTAYVNSFFPHHLEAIGARKGIKIIHLSTDCVFIGQKGSYTETDAKDEMNMYGLSKSIGEIINDRDLTIRTSIIGPELKNNGKGLFHWFMKQDGNINGYTNVYWSGVTTLELARGLHRAIEEDLRGLYQLVPDCKISKFDLLSIIKKEFNTEKINILPYSSKVVDKSLICTRNDFNFRVNNYVEMIKEMKEWMIQHRDLYTQYF